MTLRERAAGRWREIVTGLGVDESLLDGKHHPCPACGGTDRFRWVGDGNGGFFCGDTRGDGFQLIEHLQGCDFASAARVVESVVGRDDAYTPVPHEPSYAERLRPGAVKSPRSRYLESRGLEVPPGVRWHRSVFNDGKSYAAMLAPVTRAGKFLTYHITYLKNGRKADVDPCRRILPGPSNRGASIALYPTAETMGVAEGIETAIAAKMLHGVPVWSALNTSLLKCWEPPAEACHIVIFADNDENYAGQAAAYALAHRLHGRYEVEIAMPTTPGDWNDVLLAQRDAA